jgi:hypothetical protein
MLSVALLLWCCLPLPARASSYLLESIPTLVSRGEVYRLYRAGVHTTDELVWRGATPQARQDLGRRTGLPEARVLALAALSDLMRVRGVGPDAAAVISAAGCHNLVDLQQADPQTLAGAIRRVNDATHMTKNPPKADNLSAWIKLARRLPRVFWPEEPVQTTPAR